MPLFTIYGFVKGVGVSAFLDGARRYSGETIKEAKKTYECAIGFAVNFYANTNDGMTDPGVDPFLLAANTLCADKDLK